MPATQSDEIGPSRTAQSIYRIAPRAPFDPLPDPLKPPGPDPAVPGGKGTPPQLTGLKVTFMVVHILTRTPFLLAGS